MASVGPLDKPTWEQCSEMMTEEEFAEYEGEWSEEGAAAEHQDDLMKLGALETALTVLCAVAGTEVPWESGWLPPACRPQPSSD